MPFPRIQATSAVLHRVQLIFGEHPQWAPVSLLRCFGKRLGHEKGGGWDAEKREAPGGEGQCGR